MDFNFLSQVLYFLRKRGVMLIMIIGGGGYFLNKKYPNLKDKGKPYFEKYETKLEDTRKKIESIKK